MSSTSTNPGRGRSRRSGRRPRSGERREGRRDATSMGGNATVATYSPKPEPGFWQKIVSFFTGDKTSAKTPAKRSSRSSETPRDRSSREPRRDSEKAPRPTSAPRERRSGIRKPESVEVTSPRLYVGNLSFDATESDLFELFNGLGHVQNVEVVSNKHTLRSKGFAFVQMFSVEEAKRAVEELHDKEYMGRKLVVSGAKALEERRSDRERPEQQPEQ